MDEKQDTINKIAELAQKTDRSQGLDLSGVSIDIDKLYQTMASHAYEKIEGEPEEKRAVTALLMITSLMVENFSLRSKE